jgi:NAD-dependent SIR2 family protein deacetylase
MTEYVQCVKCQQHFLGLDLRQHECLRFGRLEHCEGCGQMVPADVYEMHGMECRGRVEEHLRYQGHEGTLGGFNV